jgi:uridine kinase
VKPFELDSPLSFCVNTFLIESIKYQWNKFMSYVIIFSGGTASGKTTIANEIIHHLDALVLTHDRYYKDIEIQEGHNFDEPEALDNDRIIEDIKSLKERQPTEVPRYHFPTHKRLPVGEILQPQKFLIVEGILTLAVPGIAELADLKIYVDAPDDIRLSRRIQRDVVDRGRSVTGVLRQYMETVRPMHKLHIEPSKDIADIVLHGTTSIDINIEIVVNELRHRNAL